MYIPRHIVWAWGQFISQLVSVMHLNVLSASPILTGCVLSHSLPIDVTLAVFAVGAQNTEGWDFLYSKYQSSLSSTEKSQIEFALCTSQNKEKLQWWVIHSCSCGQGKLNEIRSFWHLFSFSWPGNAYFVQNICASGHTFNENGK